MSRILRWGLLAVLLAVPIAIPTVAQAGPAYHGHRAYVRSNRYCGPNYHWHRYWHYRHCR